MNKIRKIRDADRDKICSQQVILDLANTAKELVENALDSGANAIDVKLKDLDVQVTDNGSGIPESHFDLLGSRHATTKIDSFEGVYSVDTFGFRGEALHSLASLSKMTIITCTDPPLGTRLEYESGKQVSRVKAARSKGTTVSLTDLFAGLPVRSIEFKRNIKRELAKATELLTAYAIGSLGVRLSLTCNKHVAIKTDGSNHLKDVLCNVYDSKQVSFWMPVTFDFQHVIETDNGPTEHVVSVKSQSSFRQQFGSDAITNNGIPFNLLPSHW